MNNNYIYEFEITLPDGEVCYQVNNSPKLTKEFVDYLEDIDIDIYQCIYKVFNTENELHILDGAHRLACALYLAIIRSTRRSVTRVFIIVCCK